MQYVADSTLQTQHLGCVRVHATIMPPQKSRKTCFDSKKKRGAEAPRSGVGSRVGLLNDFAMKVDIRTFDFGFFLDPQADDQVDNLQDDG